MLRLFHDAAMPPLPLRRFIAELLMPLMPRRLLPLIA